MFGRKAKALKIQVDQLSSENESLKKHIFELESELAALKEQESNVTRVLTEAGKTAEKIEQEANQKRDELLAEAEQKVKTAETEAEEIKELAKLEADEYSEKVRSEADKYSDDMRTNVNIYVERTIMASQLEVQKRRIALEKINALLKETTAKLTMQNNAFISMLGSAMEENVSAAASICGEFDKCSCSCEDCADPCGKVSGDNGDTPAETTAEAVPEFPEEYESPAQLMQSIYRILQRELPDNEEYDAEPLSLSAFEKCAEIKEEEPAAEKIESDLPHDEELSSLISDVTDI